MNDSESPKGCLGETWRAGGSVGLTLYAGDTLIGVLDTQEHARLAACAPEMARMLLALEWADGGARCPVCGGLQHAADCAWLLLMRKAGLR